MLKLQPVDRGQALDGRRQDGRRPYLHQHPPHLPVFSPQDLAPPLDPLRGVPELRDVDLELPGVFGLPRPVLELRPPYLGSSALGLLLRCLLGAAMLFNGVINIIRTAAWSVSEAHHPIPSSAVLVGENVILCFQLKGAWEGRGVGG